MELEVLWMEIWGFGWNWGVWFTLIGLLLDVGELLLNLRGLWLELWGL